MKKKTAGVLVICLLVLAGCANESRRAAGSSPSGGSTAVGDEYAAEMGLIRHDWNKSQKLQQTAAGLTMDGKLLTGCEAPSKGNSFAFKILPNGHLYCFEAETDLEVWIMSERLGGHVPTQEEIDDASADFVE